MRLWIKAVLLTLWHGVRYLAPLAFGYWIGCILEGILPETVIRIIAITSVAAILLSFVALVIYVYCAFVSANHSRLEKKQKEAV